jgi:hypothetical protein
MTVKTAQIDHRLQNILGRDCVAVQEKPSREFEQENRKRHVYFGSRTYTRTAGIGSRS